MACAERRMDCLPQSSLRRRNVAARRLRCQVAAAGASHVQRRLQAQNRQTASQRQPCFYSMSPSSPNSPSLPTWGRKQQSSAVPDPPGDENEREEGGGREEPGMQPKGMKVYGVMQWCGKVQQGVEVLEGGRKGRWEVNNNVRYIHFPQVGNGK